MNSRPFNVGQSLNEAVALQRQGQLREAEKIYSRVLKAVPDNFDALNLLGAVKLQQGQIGEAQRLLSAAVKANPRAAGTWCNLGQALHALKRAPEALGCLDKARALAPDDLNILNQHANVLITLARPEEALAEFQQVLARAPNHVEARLNSGLARAMLGFSEQALADFDAALQFAPGHPGVHYNRGVALIKLGRYAEAVEANGRALDIAPGYANAWLNRGKALMQLNRIDEAIAGFAKALAISKDFADAHFNNALALLTRGDYARGFAEYEWRWRRTGMPPQKSRGKPLWLGEYPLARKTVLLHAEQGLGDTIQFARYVPLIAASGAKVVLEVQAELQALLRRLDGASAVIARGETSPPFDVHCPLGSLPLALRTELGTVPAQIPYLSADEASLAKWSARLEALPRPRIAVAWSGNPGHDNDRNRSIAFARLAPLFAAPASFISIQKDVRAEDAAPLAAESRVTQHRRRAGRFQRHRGRPGIMRSRHRRGYRRRAFGRRYGPSGLGARSLCAGLALDARRRDHTLVSDGAAVPADVARRLGRRHRAGGGSTRTRPQRRLIASFHRREPSRQINVDLLGKQVAGTAGRRPYSVRDRLVAQPRALVEALIGPDVHEARHRARHRSHGGENRRYGRAAGNGLAPEFDGRRQAVGPEQISPHLVARTEHSRPQRGNKIERDEDIHRRGGDEFADAERISRLEQSEPGVKRWPDISGLADQQNLIDCADVGVPACQQGGVVGECLAQDRERLRVRARPHGDDRDVVVFGQISLPFRLA